MKRQKARTIIVLIAGVSILTLFCGSIFACLIPISIDSNKDVMAGCASNGNQKGDKTQETCYSTEVTHAQNNIKLPHDIKAIRAVTILDQAQTSNPDHIILTAVCNYLADINYLSDQTEIYKENRNLRL